MFFFKGLFNADAMEPVISRSKTSEEPELKEMAVKAVELLRKNANGYFLMVEGGLIDDAHHRGLAARALQETIALADAVEAVDNITADNDTLLIGTSTERVRVVFVKLNIFFFIKI